MDGSVYTRLYVKTRHEREMQNNVQCLMSFATVTEVRTGRRACAERLRHTLSVSQITIRIYYIYITSCLVTRTKFRCSSLNFYKCKLYAYIL